MQCEPIHADSIEYGPLHGYTLLENEDVVPLFPFGHGLGYAPFAYRALGVRRSPSGIRVEVSVRNRGDRRADEVVQLYVGFPGAVVSRPARLLKGFQRVALEPGETRTTRFSVPHEALRYWCPTSRSWKLEPGEHRVYAGGSSASDALLEARVRL